MTNKPEQLTNEKLSWFHDTLISSAAMGLDVTIAAEQILRLTTELQERRKADEMMVAVCEVCSRPCNNPNHPQKAVRASDGVFTKDPCALANARGRKVQGYVELELANMFYKGNKD